MTRQFHSEHLVDGALYHRLDCGHVHPAQNDPDNAMLPVEKQECRECARGERRPN